jgi:tetratricopeptide (TPR) repeat protein
MEETLPAEQPGTESPRSCANCGQPALEGDYPAVLCFTCRERFTRLSIPIWVKAFAIGIGALLLFSLFTLPKNIALGIHLKRGETAIGKKNYFTAEQELKKTLEKIPDNMEANGHMVIAAFYNQDFDALGMAVKKIGTQNIEDKELYTEISSVLDKAEKYTVNDSFVIFRNAHPKQAETADTAWRGYIDRNPDDRNGAMEYASVLFDRKDYVHCDSIIQLILKGDNEYFPALIMETSLKRETGDMDAALEYGRRIMAINHESAYGLASEARTLLRQKKDGPALDLALKAYGFKPAPYMKTTLILAYHFNGRGKDRDALIKLARAEIADAADSTNLQYALDVMDHKEKFRD